MSDREEFLRGDFSFLDIDEQMFRDAGAIYGEDSVCAAQDCFDRLLRLAAGRACQHEGDAFFRRIGGSGGQERTASSTQTADTTFIIMVMRALN